MQANSAMLPFTVSCCVRVYAVSYWLNVTLYRLRGWSVMKGKFISLFQASAAKWFEEPAALMHLKESLKTGGCAFPLGCLILVLWFPLVLDPNILVLSCTLVTLVLSKYPRASNCTGPPIKILLALSMTRAKMMNGFFPPWICLSLEHLKEGYSMKHVQISAVFNDWKFPPRESWWGQ